MKKLYPEPYLKPGKPHYVFEVVEGGRRRRLSTGERTKEAARARIREYIDAKCGGTSPNDHGDQSGRRRAARM